MYQRALRIFEATEGPDSLPVATVTIHLANAFMYKVIIHLSLLYLIVSPSTVWPLFSAHIHCEESQVDALESSSRT